MADSKILIVHLRMNPTWIHFVQRLHSLASSPPVGNRFSSFWFFLVHEPELQNWNINYELMQNHT